MDAPDEQGSSSIKRFFGNFSVQNNSENAGIFTFGLGVSIVPRDLVAALGAGLPNPIGGSEQGWYYNEINTRDWVAQTNQPGVLFEAKFDIRTGRRLRSGFSLVAIFETLGNPGGTQWSFFSRAVWERG